MSMKILDRYIAKTVLSSIGLVTLMLIGLQIFILFVGELSDLGRVDYGIVQATVFILLQIPYQVYLFFPMASLLGCLIGLGILANHSELVIMRASGMSIGQITWAVLKASILLIVLITALGETLVPYLSHYANDYKTAAVSGGQALRTSKGSWLRYGNDFISVGLILPNNVLYEVYQFRFDVHHHLKMSRFIREARYTPTGWVAYDIQQTDFDVDKTKTQTFASLPWDVSVKPKILAISSIEPDEMTLHELNRYIREQKHNHQNVHTYQFAFLQRIIQPFTTMVMMILAIPFIFGPLRSTTMGSKLLVGAAVGFSFHILSRFFGPLSTVFQLPPELAALGPTFIFALLGLYLMRKVR
ncbi:MULTISPECIES: LPS export ABC transporter permease LptG [Legionella]|uniref:LPS export ABC transporter permease LptG n=1 Tax=Legionella resiliens TaxID=2905958 RepID=A0ABS8X2A8_9GAMM|nr:MULTISPECIES: LPS export ABC transporter permease LptG [unclassified Legionella]MCE0722431.1 LPS export ABC transporter permease LptG [Legionella sp. 9fVS26]MCE3531585.1 LPS export ABC transporter permease LptG [Legionella sp. 8cVS16]QLZ67604.1 LPS export ABC transporter permease LptG [Legionella sp. PC1000]